MASPGKKVSIFPSNKKRSLDLSHTKDLLQEKKKQEMGLHGAFPNEAGFVLWGAELHPPPSIKYLRAECLPTQNKTGSKRTGHLEYFP